MRPASVVQPVSIAACTLLTALPLAAQGPVVVPRAGAIEVAAYGQVTGVDASQARFETRTPLSLGIRGSVQLHRGIGVEMEASTGMVDGAGVPVRRRYNQLVARGTVTRPLSEFSGLVLGAGIARSDYEITYNFGPSLLLGVRTAIRGRYTLRSDAIVNYLPASGAREFGLRTGVLATYGPFDGPTSRDRARGNHTVQEPGTLEAGLFAQQWALAPVWNLRSGRAIGSRVGAVITSRSAVEVEATYGRQAVHDGGARGQTGVPLPAGATYRVTTFAFRYVHSVPVGSRMALLAGIGPARSSFEYTDDWGLSGVGGARLAVTRALHLRAEVSAHYTRAPRVLDTSVRIGASTLLRLGR